MGGMGILYLMMRGFLDTLINGAPLSGALGIFLLVLGFAAGVFELVRVIQRKSIF